MGWWHTATREQRLAQIDGAIELGMTAYQCAMNFGCVYEHPDHRDRGHLVRTFAADHGRLFPWDAEKEARRAAKSGAQTSARLRREWGLVKAKDAYLAGEPVNFWGAE